MAFYFTEMDLLRCPCCTRTPRTSFDGDGGTILSCCIGAVSADSIELVTQAWNDCVTINAREKAKRAIKEARQLLATRTRHAT